VENIGTHYNKYMSIADIIGKFAAVLYRLVLIAFPLVTIVFIWGLIKYIGFGAITGEETSAQQKTGGKRLMVFGIVTLFIMISIWGIIFMLSSTFGLTNIGIPGFRF